MEQVPAELLPVQEFVLLAQRWKPELVLARSELLESQAWALLSSERFREAAGTLVSAQTDRRRRQASGKKGQWSGDRVLRIAFPVYEIAASPKVKVR